MILKFKKKKKNPIIIIIMVVVLLAPTKAFENSTLQSACTASWPFDRPYWMLTRKGVQVAFWLKGT